MPESDSNGRVTLAEIKKDIEYLTRKVESFCSETRHSLEDLDYRANVNRQDIIRMEERQKQTTGWLAGLQAIAMAIGAALGRIGQT